MAIHNLSLEIITPVHVGMGREKNYIKGLDFIYNKAEKIYTIVFSDKLLSSLSGTEIGAVSSFLSNGDFDKFNEYVKNKKLLTDEMFSYKWPSQYECNDEIKRHIQDGLGHWLIPGSSLKGSIRGILLSYLYNNLGQHGPINEKTLLGNIENNLMRFIQISDCVLNTTPGIYPVKIFSADPNNEGRWKHQRNGGHRNDFNSIGFVTYYEMLNDGVNSEPTSGEFRISFGNWGGDNFLFDKKRNEIPNLSKIFGHNGGNGIRELIKMIKQVTDNFLEKEIKFFENYPNSALTNDTFFDELRWLKKENMREEKSCLLRLGANEGWHSITGDWKFDSFIRATEDNRNNFNGRMQKAYKTRKIIFDWKPEGNDDIQRFVLPGFVKISHQNN